MPRKKSHYHPLYGVREAAGLTQAKLAELLGVNRDTIKKVENGKLAMSKDVATKARHQLGCSILRTAEGKWSVSDKVLRESGEWTPYTNKDYRDHRKALDDSKTGVAGAWSIGLVSATRLLVEAANRKGVLSAVAYDLESVLADTLTKYGLEAALVGYLQEEFEPQLSELADEYNSLESIGLVDPEQSTPETAFSEAQRQVNALKAAPAMTGLRFSAPTG